MFTEFFIKEIKTALKQPMVYIFFLLFAAITFGAVVSDNIQIGGAIGNVHKNAPHVVAFFTAILSLFGLLMATAFFNNAALRDYNNGFHEILFTTPLQKSGYFFGRFLGALVLATLPLTGIFFGVIVGSFIGPAVGWLDADRIGPIDFSSFTSAYLLFVFPNMLFAGAIIFALATKWKSTTVSFVGALGIIVGYFISGTFLSDIENDTIAAVTDVFGIRAHTLDTRYFTPAEKNTTGASFSGFLLLNRMVWSILGIVVLFVSYSFFSFKQTQRKAKKKAEGGDITFVKSERELVKPIAETTFSSKLALLHFTSFFKMNFASIVRSNTFIILFIFCVIMLVSDMVGGFEMFGLQSYPVTYKMIDMIASSSQIFMIIILVFFSGELVWRDRTAHINEVIDASPHISFISLFAKTVSLVSVIAVLHFLFVALAILSQLFRGYTSIEVSLYFQEFFLNQLPAYLTWGMMLIFLQIILSNKYIGYFVSILLIFLQGFIFLALDIRSNMVSIAGTPSLQYSDMNGFGPGLEGAIWFNIYWVLFGGLVLLMSGLLWNRGVNTGLRNRFKLAKKSAPAKYKLSFAVLGIVWLVTAGFVFYNTQVLNPYQTPDEQEALSVAYEKKYKQYQDMALPKITSVKYYVGIYPKQRNVKVKTKMALKNTHDTAIDSIHFNVSKDWQHEIELPNSKLVLNDEELDYRIYQLSQPLKPGETLFMEVDATFISNGFENERGNTNVVQNGTFLNNMQLLPMMGYAERRELQAKNTRKEHGLKPKDRMPKLEGNCNENCMSNYLSDGRADWVNVETIISTSNDQVAIAPGSLINEWSKNDRNYYHYKVDHPSQNFYSFISGRYEVERKKWNGIDIEVYYDEKHPQNVKRMVEAVENSLKYYTENFGPYFHKQARIIEFPRYASFAQAFPGTMPYSEAIGFIINLENEEDNNIVDAVIAHEMAHQWWAHQECGANMQGGTMLTESFSEYSSLMVMKQYSDDTKMKQFLKYDLDRYLRGRSREVEKELPLYKVENQQYLHYGKGSVILYALQDYIGEDKVNKALKNFLEEFRYREPPYPTSMDFMKHLEPEVPDSLQYLITDWFKEITLYDFRLKEANYTKKGNGKYETTFQIEAYKLKADSLGNETKVPLNDWVDIGLFTDTEEKELAVRKRVKFNEKEMVFTLESNKKPAKAAVDPRRILIERQYDDNIKTVKSDS